MARSDAKGALDRHIEAIVARAAREIASAVRRNIAAEVARLVAEGESGAAGRQRRVIVCPVTGCGAPGGGPKWGWFCVTHKDLPAPEKQRARTARDRRTRR